MTNFFLWSYLVLFLTSPVWAADPICLNCHGEKSLLSEEPCSRWQEYSHPVYVKPSSLVIIPEQYPLNERGQIDCNTCHDVFGESPPNEDKIPLDFTGKFLLRGKPHNSIMCKQCHISNVAVALSQEKDKGRYGMIQDETFSPDKEGLYMKGKKTLFNHPVDIQMSRFPRQITNSGGQEGIKKDQIICETCHTAHFASGNSLLVIDNSESKLCGQCHAPKFGLDRETTALKGTHPVNIIPSTSDLSIIITLRGGQLGRDKKMVCLTCHSMHSAMTDKSLLVTTNERNSFCFSCHFNIERKIMGTRHDLSLTAPREKNAWGQTAAEGGLCSPCHVVHGGKSIKMWARTIDKADQEDPIKSLCSSCHAQGKPGAASQIGIHTHPTGISISLADNPYVRLPLFSKRGVRVGKGLITCASCHNIHKWDPDSDDKGQDPEVNGSIENSFLRKRNIQSALCFECHISSRLIEGTSHDLNTAIYDKSLAPQLVLKGRKKVEGTTGICDHCHTVHNAVFVMLWARQIGTGDNFMSSICFSCHSDSMVAQHMQIGKNSHPVDIGIDVLKEEINPQLPLFSDNLRKEFRGKIFCNTCHDSHRWDPNTETRTGKPDGSNSFLRISAVDPQKNLCGECHPEQNLIMKSKHDLLSTKPEFENLKGLTPDRSGVCGVCHATHNAATQVMLWNQPFGSGDDLFSRACSGCHGKDKLASAIGISHPVNVSTFSVIDDLSATTMPIYDAKYRVIKLDMEPSLSPIQVQSLLTLDKGDESYRDDLDMVRKFNYLKQMYIDIKREKNIIKDKLITFIEEKSIQRESLIETENKLKKTANEYVQHDSRHQQLKVERRKLEQKVGIQKGQLRAVQIELGMINRNQDPILPRKAPGKKPSAKPSKSSPPSSKRPKRHIRLVKAERSYLEAVKKSELAQKEFTSLIKKKREIKSLRDNLKIKVVKMNKAYGALNLKLGKDNKKYKLLKTKMGEIREQLKEINPKSFMAVERDLGGELRAGEELLNESEMDFKIKYLTLLSKLDIVKTKKSTVGNKYRSIRTRYIDLLLNPKLRKEIPDMELDEVLDEELMDEIIGDVGHDPFGKMFCPTCHNVHGAKNEEDGKIIKSFLRIPNSEGYQLCTNCHREKEWIVGTDHDLSVTAPEEKNALGKTNEDSGVCSACHLVHNAVESFRIWAKKIDREKIDRLTTARKRKKELKKLISLQSAEFKQVSESIKKIRAPKESEIKTLKKSKTKLARLQKKLKRIDKLKKLSKKQRKLVRRKYKQQIAFLNKYLQKVTKTILGSDKKTKKIKDDYKKLKKDLKDSKTEYELLSEKTDRMEVELTRSNWDALSLLCNSCHGEDLCAEEKMIGYNSHPMNVKGQYFLQEVVEMEQADSRDEKKNTAMDKLQKMLAYPFYTQGGKRDFESGRMFCPTCHDIHQWDPENPSKGSGVPEEGDIYNSFLRDRSFPSPTLCINCHPQNVLVVGTEHDLSISAPYAKNAQGKTAANGGVCSPCHVVHNSIDRYRLWSRPLGPSYLPTWSKRYRLKDFKPIQLCTSCHQEGQWAEEKAPEEGLHYYNPLYYLKEVAQILVKPKFAYFDYNFNNDTVTNSNNKTIKMGVREILHGAKPRYPVHTVDGEISDRGNINCFTCHNPHQWDPDEKKEGPGKQVEGDITNSFLKKDTAKNFCSDCHTTKALYNYTYFHLNRNRLNINREIKADNPHWKKMQEEKGCTSCHRDNPRNLIHPVDIVISKESAQYKYPQNIPLDNGKIICVSCHNPKLQTEVFAMVRDKNRNFLRGLYDNLTVVSARAKVEKVVVGGPPAAMFQLEAGPKNLGVFAKAKEKSEDNTTAWIKMSMFIQYQVCYNCHKEEDYQQFSPHRQQITDGKINHEMCFLCHSEIPDRKNIQKSKEGFKLRAEIEFYCIDCHREEENKHPGGANHFGKIMTDQLRKQFSTTTDNAPSQRYLPLKGGKLVCPSCHNIHQDGVILNKSVGNGEPEKKWLRLDTKNICDFCHKRTSEYTPDKSGSPF